MEAIDPLRPRLLALGDSGVGLPDAIGAVDPLRLALDAVRLLANGLTLCALHPLRAFYPLGLALDALRAFDSLSLTLDPPILALDPLGLALDALRTLDSLSLALDPLRLALGALRPFSPNLVRSPIAFRRGLAIVLVAVAALAAGRGCNRQRGDAGGEK